jgi:hypothetical protein
MNTLITANKYQVSSDLKGEAVILHLKSGVYYGLNEVGARIWELLQHPQTVASIRDALLAEYEVDREICERDLLAILQDLKAAELIDVTGELSIASMGRGSLNASNT